MFGYTLERSQSLLQAAGFMRLKCEGEVEACGGVGGREDQETGENKVATELTDLLLLTN